jgi:hypothetical protein
MTSQKEGKEIQRLLKFGSFRMRYSLAVFPSLPTLQFTVQSTFVYATVDEAQSAQRYFATSVAAPRTKTCRTS